MHHAAARHAITSIIAGDGFGEQALALSIAAAVDQLPGMDPRRQQALVARGTRLPRDRAALRYQGPLLDAPIPHQAGALCQQLLPIVAAHPVQTGMQLACLRALCALWPHVASDERPRMRQRFLDRVPPRAPPPPPPLQVQQLRNWQRDLHTSAGELQPSVASLRGILSEREPKAAYLILADHLGCSMDLQTLHWVLGALSVQVLLQVHDRDGFALQCLLGTVAGEQLATAAAPEHLATVVSQLAHQLWWCRQRAHLPPIIGCVDEGAIPLPAAIASGDISAAQRAARRACADAPRFWDTAWGLVDDWTDCGDRDWMRVLAVVAASAWRTGTSENAICPDDAAAIGAVLADLSYHRQRIPANAAR